MDDVGVHADRLESLLADLVVSGNVAAPKAIRRIAAAYPRAHALDLAFALGSVAAGLDQPALSNGPRSPALIAALYRAHVALTADIFGLTVRDRDRATCADLLSFWRELADGYFA